ncbi:MAG: hypothetical protein JWM88_478 [Verrucomicrobia bacterium]|nr:hypothetical protein [Verrucomicrobiota bacterium]
MKYVSRSVTLRRTGFVVLTALASLSSSRAVTNDERFVIQSVDITRAGKKLPPPSPETPTYYIPIFQGYKELGAVSKDYERKPPDEETARQLINMLAKQGYRMASKQFHPTIVLVFQWGSIVPIEVDSANRAPGQPPLPGHVTNAAEIKAYVVGERGRDLDRHYAYYSEMTNLEARHYLMISAFEYRRGDEESEVLLWRAHVTTELWGNFLSEVLPLMIAHAAPIVGRNVPPGGAWTPRNAQVIIGAPVVVPESGATGKKK